MRIIQNNVRKARQIVNEYQTVYISQVVQVETVWVLSRAYGFSRKEIALVLESLLNNQSFRLENETIFTAAFPLYCSSNIDFSDAIILQTSEKNKLKLLSFDKKLQKQEGVVSP
jgi:predicted nucleic-acid-binding protein